MQNSTTDFPETIMFYAHSLRKCCVDVLHSLELGVLRPIPWSVVVTFQDIVSVMPVYADKIKVLRIELHQIIIFLTSRCKSAPNTNTNLSQDNLRIWRWNRKSCSLAPALPSQLLLESNLPWRRRRALFASSSANSDDWRWCQILVTIITIHMIIPLAT